MTTTYLTPGVYRRPAERIRPVGPLVRSDVTAFFGYTRRGPALRPVRVESSRELVAQFGEPYDVGYLGPAVRAFFENGGSTCWIVRVVDPSASEAEMVTGPVELDGEQYRWRFSASFNAALLNEPEGTDLDGAAGRAGKPGLAAVRRLPDPGARGNQLRVSLSRTMSFRTHTVAGLLEEGFVTEVEGLGGLEPHSVVQLHQDGAGGAPPVDAVIAIRSVDWALGRITWAESLAALGFDPGRSIRLESVEVDVRVAVGGRVVERFQRLGVHPEHERALTRVVPRESRLLDVALLGPAGFAPDALPWNRHELWPPELDATLSGGTDGLTEVSAAEYEAALEAAARVDEIALLAAPDLVLRAVPPPPRPCPAPAPPACTSLEPPPTGVVFGRVVTRLEAEGPERPVAGVEVVDVASGVRARSDASGDFLLEGVGPDLVTLRLEKAGFETFELPAQVELVRPAVPVDLFLTPLLLPRALTELEILAVQRAMARQGERGLYRFALLDPPVADADTQRILSWRARLGDTPFAALYYPWLAVRPEAVGLPAAAAQAGPSLAWIPPSGHVAGATADTDRTEGVHRLAANRRLSLVEDVTVEVDDARQGVLNPAGVNCIRVFPGRGVRIYGGRTLGSDPEWRYVNVRRLVLVLEETLEKALQWAVFEPNDTFRRQALSMSITKLLERMRRSGALAGASPEAAYRVKCDEDNNPPALRDAGRLLAEVSVAPAVPFEFVTFRLGRTADALEVTE